MQASRTQVRVALGTAVAAAITAITVAVLPSNHSAGSTTSPATSVAPNGQSASNSQQETTPLPNLTDPVARRNFVCSFAAGSFGISPQLQWDRDDYCGATDTTSP